MKQEFRVTHRSVNQSSPPCWLKAPTQITIAKCIYFKHCRQGVSETKDKLPWPACTVGIDELIDELRSNKDAHCEIICKC